MRTKHLLYSIALVSALAACTNDDFLESAQGSQEGMGMERPTISNVVLDLNEANTRLEYNGKYSFQDGDKMSVILMDENNTGVRYGSTTNTDEWNELSWLEKYHLVDYAHTNLPFIYDAEENVFNSNADNVLEGNYFMTLPYAPLDGNRQVRIDIADQTQYGDAMDQDVRANFIAKNQQFVGYGQLKAGEGISRFNVSLVPVLFPYYFTIQNNSGNTLHVTKVVLSHSMLTGTLTLDPTRAYYNDPTTSAQEKGWNLETSYVKKHTDSWATENPGDIYHFNYANFLANQTATKSDSYKKELYDHERYGSMEKMDYVYNIDGEAGDVSKPWVNVAGDDKGTREAGKYYWDDAVRAVVQPMREFNNPEYATQYLEVKVRDGYYGEDGNAVETGDCLTLNNQKKIRVAMMLPKFDLKGSCESLKLTIYTKEGVIQTIDLSKQNEGIRVDTQTSGILDRNDPTDNKVREMIITLDAPSISKYPNGLTINNEDDLLQLVNWMNDGAESADKNPQVCFTNDITIDDELAAAIEKLNANTILSIYSAAAPGNNLRVATSEAHANILEHLDVASNVTVEVMNGGVLNMTEKSYNIAHEITSGINGNSNYWGKLLIEVAEGGTLNIVSNDRYSTQTKPELNLNDRANYTEVYIDNAGDVNVNDVQVVGFFIHNDGNLNVQQGASISFADADDLILDQWGWEQPKSINTIRGTVYVFRGGKMSGTTNKYFENFGTIYNAGEVSNILNLGNPDKTKKPGTIVIADITAKTGVSENTGVVNYQEFLAGVTVQDPNAKNTGEYIYTGPAGKNGKVNSATKVNEELEGINLAELNKAMVTIATITNDTLFADAENAVTTLKTLILKDGSAVAAYCVRDQYNKITEYQRGVLFQESKGTVIFEAGSAAKNVYFQNLKPMDDTHPGMVKSVLVKGNGQGSKAVCFDGGAELKNNTMRIVSFYTKSNKDYAPISFESANLTVNAGTTVVAEALRSVDGTSSTVVNDGTIKLAYASYVDTNITLDGFDPVAR